MTFPSSHYDYCKHKDIKDLSMPPVDFWPIYSWAWKGKITKEGIVSRLDKMVKRGIKRLYILPLTSSFSGIIDKEETAYMSDGYFEMFDVFVEESKKKKHKALAL